MSGSRSVGESAKLIPHSGRSYGPGTPRQRHDDARHPSSDTAIEGSDPRARRRAWAEPQDGHEWRQRAFVTDAPMGPKVPRSTTLSLEQEAIAVAFRRHSLLPLDDCLYALQATIPGLTRSSLHRLFQRHAIARLPEIDGEKAQRSGSSRPHWLLPHRHRRGAHGSRQAPSVRRRRPDREIRLRPAARSHAGASPPTSCAP